MHTAYMTDCTTNYPTNLLIEFADLTAAFWDESANREEIQKLTVSLQGECVERIHSFKFLEH